MSSGRQAGPVHPGFPPVNPTFQPGVNIINIFTIVIYGRSIVRCNNDYMCLKFGKIIGKLFVIIFSLNKMRLLIADLAMMSA
jgi:hypothetical protein